MIKEDYVSYEVAKLLNEKRFDEPCLSYFWSTKDFDFSEVPFTNKNMYRGQILRPTLQMACKWLREEKKLVISIDLNYSDNSYSYSIDSIIEHRIVGYGLEKTYEEAVEAALKYTLENLI